MADLDQFWGHEREDWEPRRWECIDLKMTRTLNLRRWAAMIVTSERVQEDPPLGQEPSIMEWVYTAHTDWVKKRTLEFKRLHLNLNKHCLINDQKQEPEETMRNPPPASQLVLLGTLSMCANIKNHILLFNSIHKVFFVVVVFFFPLCSVLLSYSTLTGATFGNPLNSPGQLYSIINMKQQIIRN